MSVAVVRTGCRPVGSLLLCANLRPYENNLQVNDRDQIG